MLYLMLKIKRANKERRLSVRCYYYSNSRLGHPVYPFDTTGVDITNNYFNLLTPSEKICAIENKISPAIFYIIFLLYISSICINLCFDDLSSHMTLSNLRYLKYLYSPTVLIIILLNALNKRATASLNEKT